MKRYRKVTEATWNRIRKCSDDEKLMYLYLYSGHHATSSGVLRIDPLYLSADMQWKIDRVDKSLDGLIAGEHIGMIPDMSLLWIKAWWDDNASGRSESRKVMRNALEQYKRVPELREFLLESGLFPELKLYVSKKPRAEDVEQTSEQPNEKEQELEIGNKTSVQEAVQDYSPDFCSFWIEYPRKQSKADAFKAWTQIARFRPEIADIIAAVKRGRESRQWQKDNGQYIPMPATWLRAHGWLDEYDTKAQRQVEGLA